MAWVAWPTVYLIHVGDSRAYLYRDSKLELLSHDQTLAQALADNGVIDAGDVETHRFSNVLVSALGCTSNMEPLYGRHELEPNDKLMICSDGLTKHVSEARIAEILAEDDCAEVACNRLVDTALGDGGTDNITTVLARFMANLIEPDEAINGAVDLEAESPVVR
jgi:protein phosphatase